MNISISLTKHIPFVCLLLVALAGCSSSKRSVKPASALSSSQKSPGTVGSPNLATDGAQRISVTGAIFTRDTSNPALGEAYRDPSGLIWGSVYKAQGKIRYIYESEAENLCETEGARLPTRAEFDQLAKYLGYGSEQGYNPYLADGKADLLPDLAKEGFWSSSAYEVNPSYFV